MEQSPSWEANSHSASQEIPCLLWNPKIDYHVQKSPILTPILSQMNPFHTFPPYFPKIYANIILPYTPNSGWFFPSGSTKSSSYLWQRHRQSHYHPFWDLPTNWIKILNQSATATPTHCDWSNRRYSNHYRNRNHRFLKEKKKLMRGFRFRGDEIQVVAFWIITTWTDVVGYQRFWETFCLHLQGEDI